MSFVSINSTGSAFTPSFTAGVAVTLPIFDSAPQLNTSVAVGAFYELNLLDERSYFMMTLGFNVLSLFGANK